MPKYKVLELLSTQGPDIQPGAIIEIDDDQVAANLLEKNCIIPAETLSPIGAGKLDTTTKTKEESK
jgi:hypothetical protein